MVDSIGLYSTLYRVVNTLCTFYPPKGYNKLVCDSFLLDSLLFFALSYIDISLNVFCSYV